MRKMQEGPDICRYFMYKRLSRYRVTQQCHYESLSISGSERLCNILGFGESQIVKANFPEYNVLSLPFCNNKFDWVVSDQVLEHVEGDPQTAIDETLRVVKPGGIVVHTTVFIYPIHSGPGDFWRFTPDALALLCRDFTKILEVGGWGNPFVWLLTHGVLRNKPVPETRWHPLNILARYNYPNWPIVTWIVAQK